MGDRRHLLPESCTSKFWRGATPGPGAGAAGRPQIVGVVAAGAWIGLNTLLR